MIQSVALQEVSPGSIPGRASIYFALFFELYLSCHQVSYNIWRHKLLRPGGVMVQKVALQEVSPGSIPVRASMFSAVVGIVLELASSEL